jgi:hypothetical protein
MTVDLSMIQLPFHDFMQRVFIFPYSQLTSNDFNLPVNTRCQPSNQCVVAQQSSYINVILVLEEWNED